MNLLENNKERCQSISGLYKIDHEKFKNHDPETP